MQEGFAQGRGDFLRLLQTQRPLVNANLGNIDTLEMRWPSAVELAGLAQIEAFPGPLHSPLCPQIDGGTVSM